MISLTKLPSKECQSLCHKVVDELCGRDPPRMAHYGDTWSLGEWLDLTNGLSSLFCKTVGDNCTDEEVLAGLKDVGPGYGEAVLSVLKARREEIRQALLQRTHLVSRATLQDFDWQLKLIHIVAKCGSTVDPHVLALSSDKISSLQMPLLNLSLCVREDGALRPVAIEMGREELNTLICSLEAANKVVLQLK